MQRTYDVLGRKKYKIFVILLTFEPNNIIISIMGRICPEEKVQGTKTSCFLSANKIIKADVGKEE